MSTSIKLCNNRLCQSSPMQRQPGSLRTATHVTSFQPSRYNSTNAARSAEASSPRVPDLANLDRVMTTFEDKCQRAELVNEREFARVFSLFTRAVDGIQQADRGYNIIQYSILLLKCCGRLMFDTPPKGRELLAGNTWTFIKERKIPLDVSHYNSLIRVMNENETVYDPNTILDEIKQHDLRPDQVTYQRLIHQYCLQGDVAGAMKMLEIIKDEGIELNETIFASLITGYSKQEKPPTISEMFELMRKNSVEPGTKSYSAALVGQAKRYATDPEGATAELIKVMELLDKDDVQLSAYEYIDLISNLGPLKESLPTVAYFFDRYVNNLSGSVATRYRILSSLLRVNQIDLASRLFWSQSIGESTLKRKNVGTYYVRSLARTFNLPEDFSVDECSKLEEKGWNSKALHILYYLAAEAGNLKLTRVAMKKITDREPMKAIFAWPLIAQAKDQEEIIRVIREDLNPKLDASDLIETFSQWIWPRFEKDTLKLFELSKELNYDSNMLVASLLNYFVDEDKIPEAIKFISELPQGLMEEPNRQATSGEEDGEEAEPHNVTQRNLDPGNLMSRLINQIAESTKDPELVMKTFNMCKVPGQQVSRGALASLVKVHLLNNDFNAALEQFLKICSEYRLTPCRTELMNHCLVNKDPESLQKIMSAVSDIYGEPNSLFDLAVCCLWSNKLKQAQKIFASPGFRVRPIRVYQTCRTIARQGNINVLENFVNLTCDMYDINKEFLYQLLIDTYDRTSNAKRALNLWNIMQEEEFQPSKKSLMMIANILEKNNIRVPFQKPQAINYPNRAEDRTQ